MLNRLTTSYISLIVMVLIDYFTKKWILKSAIDFDLGWMKLVAMENPGIIMGLFASIPLIVKTVYLSTVGISLFAFYIFITSYFKFKTRRFYFGSAFLFGGIVGNVIDRILYGSVVDFMAIKGLPVLNLADLFLISGLFLLILSWKTELNFHSPLNNMREMSLANKQFQTRFIRGFFVLFFCISLIVFSFSFFFLKFTLEEMAISTSINAGDYLKAYSLMFLTIIALIAGLIYIVAQIMSHRIYGPFKAIERYLHDTLAKKSYPFKLRESDHFKHLEEKLTEVNKGFNKNE